LQKDLESGGYIPEWIVKNIEFNKNGKKILAIENQISISQDPFIQFTTNLNPKDELSVSIADTQGNKFNQITTIN
jgi:sulfur-oxidizing protein SoxY